MKLYEYEAKSMAKQFDLPVPRGTVVTDPEAAREAYRGLGGEVVIKAQVLVAGRGKAGGILLARNEAEAHAAAAKLLGSTIKGERVSSILLEEKLAKGRELYVGITVNRSDRCYTLLASTAGGVDIEEIAKTKPEKIFKFNIDPVTGLQDFHGRNIAVQMVVRGKALITLGNLIRKLYQVAVDSDAELVESNPLMETLDERFVLADMRVILDDNALYRHRQFVEARMVPAGEISPAEAKAQGSGLAYVELDGDIGILGNGAGLVMATLDLVQVYGGRPANFCDVGGGAGAARVATALELLLSNERVKVVFINILGGITRCDEVAKGILDVRERLAVDRPMVIRLVGTSEEEGRRILSGVGVTSYPTMEEAAKRAVELAGVS